MQFLSRQTQRLREAATNPVGDAASARAEALTDLCHALLNTNEFLYVD